MSGDVADAFEPGAWEFTPEVAAEFDRHVRQSVPYYDDIQRLVAVCSDWLAPDGATVVDLGASTGTTVLQIAERHSERELDFWLYDESPDMRAAAGRKLDAAGVFATCVAGRIESEPFEHEGADLTLALFTLQFFAAADRAEILRKARRASKETGAILVAEKLRIPDGRWSEIATECLWDYKAENDIPSDSIRSKARALRGVLRPRTEAENLAELVAAGWRAPTVLFRWHSWTVYGAYAS